jgi:hypothetical protein
MAYFIAHSIFWALGIFASEGLMRVMLCVVPMMGLICARGMNAITEGVQQKFPKIKSQYLYLMMLVLAIHFLRINLDWRTDFNLLPSQLTELEASKKYKNKLHNEGYTLYSEAMYIDMIFGINPFDDPRHRSFLQLLHGEPVPEKSLLVWDRIMAGWMYNVPLDTLLHDKRFQLIDSFTREDYAFGGMARTIVFQTDTAFIRWKKQNEPLFFNDFESGKYANKDTSHAKQATSVIKLNEIGPYAPGLDGSVSSYFTQPTHNFKVSFDLLVEDIHALPSVVTQTMSLKGNWENFLIKTPIKEANRWHKVEVIVVAKSTNEATETFKIYVWHPNKKAAYIDNFRVDYAD